MTMLFDDELRMLKVPHYWNRWRYVHSGPTMLLQSVIHFALCLVCIRCMSVPDVPSLSVTNQSLVPDPAMGQGADFDLSYCQMLLEAPVLPPADQVPWFCTCSLCKSTKGLKGERGDRGLPGIPGGPGPRGLTGARGSPGFEGQIGLKGEKGDEGLKGERGTTGPLGSKGEKGFKGDKGDHGENGAVGEPGLKGADGQCPLSCESFSGPPGEPGLPGPVGVPGLPGKDGDLGAKGLKGDPGITGIPGTPGLSGLKGEPGANETRACQNGAKGDVGPAGSKGTKGDPSASGPQGMPGETGPKGEPGAMGMMGMPGLCSPAIQSAFSAALTLSFPVANQPVKFGRVIYNLQQHYNPNTGVYTAPVIGTYAFSFHLIASGRPLKVGLFWNFQPVVKSTQASELGTVSQRVVLHLSEGDWVWLQVKDSSTNGMFTSTETSSTFSGFLLYPDDCDTMMSREGPPPEITGVYSWGEDPDPNLSPEP